MATKKLRRLVALTCAGALLALAACSDGSSGGGETTTGGDECVISGDLNIIFGSNGPSDAAFAALNEAFMEAYPCVNSVTTPISNEAYPQAEAAQLTSGEADIVTTSGLHDYPAYAQDAKTADALYAEAGGFLALDDQAWLQNYYPDAVDMLRVNGVAYAVPVDLQYTTGVYYNVDLFEANGLSVPTTWSELLAVMDALNAAGVVPFGHGGKDVWPTGLVMLDIVHGLYPTAQDKYDLRDGLWAGTVDLASGVPLEVMEKIQTIYDNSIANFAGLGYDEMPGLFAQGAFAMLPDGTWNHTNVVGTVGSAFEVGYFPFPSSENAADNAYLSGKVGFQLAVNAASDNIPAALAWLEFMAQPENYEPWVATSGSSPAMPGISTDDFLNSIADITAVFQPAWDVVWISNPEAGADAVYPFNYPGIAPMGTMNAQAAAQAAAAAWVTSS